ncbi:MAG: metal ABC transporter solute-binding protein, Zn/Mn family [Pirellulaceae bacterium]
MFRISSLVLASLAAILLLPLAGCSPPANGSAEKDEHSKAATTVHKFAGQHPIQIVCTTGMVADLARNVGGKHVEVKALMGAGVDPHLYKASPGDLSLMSNADMVLYSGLHLEGKMTEVFENLAREKPAVPVAERGIPHDQILEVEGGAHDPHVWFDVSLWSQAAAAVRDALISFDQAHADDYKANAAAYQARLAKLHEEAKTTIATIPKEQRVMVTAHDAFRYFGRAYDIEVRGIQGISTESEAGVKQINDLVKFLSERKIKAVFVETSVSDQNIRSLLEGSSASGHKVVIGGELFSDAMGNDGTPEGTYEGMVRHNVETIVKALK